MKVRDSLDGWKRTILILSIVTIAFGAGYYLLAVFDWSILKGLDSSLLALLMAVSFIYLIIAAFAKWILLRGMGYRVSLPMLALVHAVCLSSSYAIPVRAGIPVRIWLYGTFFSIPVVPAGASIMLEMVAGVSVSLVLALIGAALLFTWAEAMIIAVVLACLLVALLGIGRLSPGEVRVKEGLIGSLLDRALRWWQNAYDSVRCVPSWSLFVVTAFYLIRQYIRAVCLRYLLLHLGVTTSVFQILIVESTSGLVGLISMLPMGIGTKDASLVMLLSRVGVPTEAAIAAALVDRALWNLVPIAVGLVAANVLGVRSAAERWREHSSTEN